MTWLFLREIGVGAMTWTREVFLPVIPGQVLQIGAGLLLLPLADSTGSLLLVATICGVTIALALAGSFVGLSKSRRRELMQMVRETAGLGSIEYAPDADLAGDLPTPAGVSVHE
jgi:hypothetical protein